MKKEREYTEMQKAFLSALADRSNKGNIRACMRIAGFSDNTPISMIISSLHEEMTDIAKKLIAAAAPQATFSLLDVLDGESKSISGNREVLDAAKSILDRAGVVKKDTDSLEVKVGSGIIILPAKDQPSE